MRQPDRAGVVEHHGQLLGDLQVAGDRLPVDRLRLGHGHVTALEHREHAVQHRDLAVVVGVVHAQLGMVGVGPRVGVGLARRDRRLGQRGDAVLGERRGDAVEVDVGGHRQAVLDDDLDLVVGLGADPRARAPCRCRPRPSPSCPATTSQSMIDASRLKTLVPSASIVGASFWLPDPLGGVALRERGQAGGHAVGHLLVHGRVVGRGRRRRPLMSMPAMIRRRRARPRSSKRTADR